jgi:hypothetical protein
MNFSKFPGAVALVCAVGSVNAQSVVEKTGLSAIHGSVKDSGGQPVAGVESRSIIWTSGAIRPC